MCTDDVPTPIEIAISIIFHHPRMVKVSLASPVEDAFPVMEADVDDYSPKDTTATLPIIKRLTPLSIMVCNTISAVRSQTLLKVPFDSGSTAMFISRKAWQGIANHVW